MKKQEVPITVTLTPDEVLFLRCCVADSASEGHYDPEFEGLDLDAIWESLAKKGVLEEETKDGKGGSGMEA